MAAHPPATAGGTDAANNGFGLSSPTVLAKLKTTICDLKIKIEVFPGVFNDLDVTICDLKRKQATRESRLLNKPN